MEISFIDLDVYVKTPYKILILDKSTDDILLELNISELFAMKHFHTNKIIYNNQILYLSDEHLKTINKTIDEVKLTFMYLSDDEIIKQYLDNVDNIIDLDIKTNIIIFTTLNNSKLLNDINSKIKNKTKYCIEKVYYIESLDNDQYNVLEKKNKIILENLIGLKIRNDKFINKKIKSFNKIHTYYDNNIDIQELFQKIYYNSDSDIQKYIINRLSNNIEIINVIKTLNKIEPYIYNSTILLPPFMYNII